MVNTLKPNEKKYLLIHAKFESLKTTEEGLHNIQWECLYKGLLAEEILIQYEQLKNKYDIIIIDRYLPVMDTLNFLIKYRELDPITPVLVIAHGFNFEDYHQIKLMSNTYYGPKEISMLKLSLQNFHKNEILDLEHSLIKHWVELTNTYSLVTFEGAIEKIKITTFEQNLLNLIGKGLSNKELAKQLKASMSHVHHTKSKLTKTFGLSHNRLLLAYGVIYNYIEI